MSRFVSLGVNAALIFVMLCCPPPLAAQQAPKVMICPITHQKCETQKAPCNPPAPDFLAAPATPPPALMPATATLPSVPGLAPPHELRSPIVSHWSAPTRTIVLRI